MSEPWRLSAAFSMAAVLLLQLSPAAADYLVLESNISSHPQHSIIGDRARLELPAGGRLTLTDTSGNVTALSGPRVVTLGDIPQDGDDNLLLRRLSSVLNAEMHDKVAGVTRTGSSETPPAGTVDIARTGTHCVNFTRFPSLWRGASLNRLGGVLEIRRAGVDGTRYVEWLPMIPTLDLGQWLDLGNATDLKLKYVMDSGQSLSLTLLHLPQDKPTLAEMVRLADRGCTQEVAALLAASVRK